MEATFEDSQNPGNKDPHEEEHPANDAYPFQWSDNDESVLVLTPKLMAQAIRELRNRHGMSRAEIVQGIKHFVQNNGILLSDEAVTARALDSYLHSELDITECLRLAQEEENSPFDKRV